MVTDLVVPMTSALATTELTVILLGQTQIVPEELAQSLLLGLEMFKIPMMLTPLLSAQTRVFVTENRANANASQITMESHANAPFAQIDAVTPVFALLKSNWQLRLVVSTPHLGMPRNKSAVCAILVDVDLIVHFSNALLALMCSKVMEMNLVVIALVVVFAITPTASAVASTDTTAPNANIKLCWVKQNVIF